MTNESKHHNREFRKLRFGYAEAQVESTRDPELLLSGFFEVSDLGEVVNGERFLVLGYKGSGKSALGEHLRLRSEIDPELFVTTTSVGDFPFLEFQQIVLGREPESAFPTAWSWLLLVQIFASLDRDEGLALSQNREFAAARQVMKSLGLWPAPELKKIAHVSAKGSFKLQVPLVFEGTIERELRDEN